MSHYSIVGRHNQDEKRSNEKKFKFRPRHKEEKSIIGEWPITITVVYCRKIRDRELFFFVVNDFRVMGAKINKKRVDLPSRRIPILRHFL